MSQTDGFHIVRVGMVKANEFPVTVPAVVQTPDQWKAHCRYLNGGRANEHADKFVLRNANNDVVPLD